MPETLELMIWSGHQRARPAERREEKVAMENLGEGKFTANIARLEKTLRYRAVTGAFSSPTYTAEAIDPPEIANVQITLYPPAYTGLGSVSLPEATSKDSKARPCESTPRALKKSSKPRS